MQRSSVENDRNLKEGIRCSMISPPQLRIPKGFRRKAQRCGGKRGATLGKPPEIISNRNAIAASLVIYNRTSAPHHWNHLHAGENRLELLQFPPKGCQLNPPVGNGFLPIRVLPIPLPRQSDLLHLINFCKILFCEQT
jgi:hypothetical protein